MPVDKNKYPADWASISSQRRLIAGNRCEWVDADGQRCPHHNGDIASGKGGRDYSIVLTTAHLDHDTTHNDLSNLRSWCQKHHLQYDASHHAENAKKTRQKKRLLSAIEVYGSESPLFDRGSLS